MGSSSASKVKAKPAADIAAEQTPQNQSYVAQQQTVNRSPQTNQFGSSIDWVPNGVDANGNPQFRQVQSLGGAGQQFASGFSGLGQQYIDAASNRPDLSGTAAFDKANGLWHSINDSNIQRQSDQLDTKLKNQGFTADSEGYKNGMQDLKDQQARDQNQFQLAAQNQAFNQAQTDYGNRLAALQPGVNYGNQSINGGFAGIPGLNVPNIDYSQLENQNFNQQMQIAQAKDASQNAMLGGIAGLGGTVLGSALGGPIGGQIGRQLAGGGGSGSSSPPLPWLTSWQG